MSRKIDASRLAIAVSGPGAVLGRGATKFMTMESEDRCCTLGFSFQGKELQEGEKEGGGFVFGENLPGNGVLPR
ncbi:MAG: hypothetical protein CVU60_07835 [Deltaproteobacteria bacterium HGW-Deltaproteobacteria-18]|jgi:Na+/alanine symporter|nr:MAG: hypothetical protein CVU60_07835 [Deltaproteobacteria bacterium HGW-Deltaproteobacteria-18]